MSVSNKKQTNDMNELVASLGKLMETQFKGVYQKIDDQHLLVNANLEHIQKSIEQSEKKITSIEKTITGIVVREASHYANCPNTELCAKIQLQIAQDKLTEEKGNVLINAIRQYPRTVLTLISVAVAGLLFSAAILVSDFRMKSQGLVSVEEFQKMQKETIHKEITSFLGERGYKNIP